MIQIIYANLFRMDSNNEIRQRYCNGPCNKEMCIKCPIQGGDLF